MHVLVALLSFLSCNLEYSYFAEKLYVFQCNEHNALITTCSERRHSHTACGTLLLTASFKLNPCFYTIFFSDDFFSCHRKKNTSLLMYF